MPFLFAGIVLLVLAYFGLKAFARMNPQEAKKWSRAVLGAGAILVGGLMTLRGLAVLGVPVIGFGMTDAERAVLERFFSGRVLNEIPSQRAKFVVVLQRLALEFDVGRRYDEREVNEILGAFHPDWSALRRGLVDEGLLDREPTPGGNQYWRSGGRVTALPDA